MQEFTGYDYLQIDVANQFGLDKDLFEYRIQWVQDHMNELEQLVDQADNKPLYQKAVMALRRAQAHQPIGHVVHFDACCSGMQIMSALTGCITGATNTGLVDPNKRADAYGILTEAMSDILGGQVEVSRKDNKQALMTVLYGSRDEPKKIFGEDTPELSAFYQAAQSIAPGAWELLQLLLNSWKPWALMHSWKLPDGFDARVKVLVDKQASGIEVDALDHATFTYNYTENEGTEKGLSNVANVVHSVDGYVLRCMVRRCNYDRAMVEHALRLMDTEVNLRESFQSGTEPVVDEKLRYYIKLYDATQMADVVILPYLNAANINQLGSLHIGRLMKIVQSMLVHEPFELVTVHDSFAAHPNNLNHVRRHYVNILAELAESNVLTDLLNQLYENPQGKYEKLSNNLGQLIRNSNYALS